MCKPKNNGYKRSYRSSISKQQPSGFGSTSTLLVVGLLILIGIACFTALETSSSSVQAAASANLSSDLPLTTHPTSPAPGMPAITPHIQQAAATNTPTFTVADASTYVNQHAMPRTLNSSHPNVLKVSFLTNAALRVLLGDDAGIGANALVCYVEVNGVFTFPAEKGEVTYHKGYEVFDAHTGNLLMWGGQP